MISDSFKDPTLPENLQFLSDELEKLLRLVNNATMPTHFDAAESYLHQFTRKWQLDSKKNPNAITAAIGIKINDKRIEWQVQDKENADNARVKSAA